MSQGVDSPAKGRPSIYTPELAAKLCAYLSAGESLITACKHPGMPCEKTVFLWLSAANTQSWREDFLQQYTRAKEEAADALVEQMLHIADTQVMGVIKVTKVNPKTGKKFTEVRTEDMLGHRRLQVESRKWIAAKLKPKKYGDKVDVTSGGEKIERGMTLEEINAILARAEAEKAESTEQGS